MAAIEPTIIPGHTGGGPDSGGGGRDLGDERAVAAAGVDGVAVELGEDEQLCFTASEWAAFRTGVIAGEL